MNSVNEEKEWLLHKVKTSLEHRTFGRLLQWDPNSKYLSFYDLISVEVECTSFFDLQDSTMKFTS